MRRSRPARLLLVAVLLAGTVLLGGIAGSTDRRAQAQFPFPIPQPFPGQIIQPLPLPLPGPIVGRITVSTGGPYAGRVGQPLLVSATVRSPLPPGTPFQFQWTFGDGGTGFGQVSSYTYRTPGTFLISLTVFGGGQTAFASTSASIIQVVQPLVVSAGGPYQSLAGQPVQFTSTASNVPFGTNVQYHWGFGDGTFGSGPAPAKVYANPGTYSVSVQASTSSGQQGSASTSVNVSRPVVPLQVSAGGSYNGTAGSTVSLVATASGAQNPRFQWNFGDGTSGSGQVASHLYQTAGSFLATVTVTDLASGQTGSANSAVTIVAPVQPQPPTPLTPLARQFASSAYHPPSGTVVLFGGMVCQGSRCSDQDDTWTWNGTVWTEQSPAVAPTSRFSASMAFHEASGKLVLFGGIDCEGTECVDSDETWTWDGATWKLENPANRPSERSSAQMEYDGARGQLVLFGGHDTGGDVLGDTWTWDGATWTAHNPTASPSARYAAGMAYDAARGVTVLFGGRNDSLIDLGDTWTWDGTNWTQHQPPQSATPRANAAVVFDAARNLVVMFGGANNANNALGDTWTWNGSTWAQQSPATNPSARYGAAAAFNAARTTFVLFSGTNGDADTWTWDGTNWTRR